MMASFLDDERNSSASSDFFSPISLPFFGKPSTSTTTTQQSAEKLPPLHDSSWIGARLSPIGSFDKENNDDDEDDDEDDRYTSIYRKALHESLEAAPFVNEQTSLLMKGGGGGGDPRSRIHPLWEQQPALTAGKSSHNNDIFRPSIKNKQSGWIKITWGAIVCILSGIYLFAMGYYDFQDANNSISDERAWRLPWLRPTENSLVLFGAFMPTQVLQGSYWRIITSSFMSTSLVEWALLVGSWRLIYLAATASSWYRWAGVYFASAVTGQLWMMAWDTTDNALSGCMSWGSTGVLCAVGIRSPKRRFVLFSIATIFMILALLQRPFSSVMGATGSAFFGWALTAAEAAPRALTKGDKSGTTENFWSFTSQIGALVILMVPTLYIAFIK